MTDEGLRHLAKVATLQHLDLTGTSVTGKGLQSLRALPALRTLTVGWSGGNDADIDLLESATRSKS